MLQNGGQLVDVFLCERTALDHGAHHQAQAAAVKMNTGEEGVKKNIMMLVGACLFLIGATIVFPAFFGYQI